MEALGNKEPLRKRRGLVVPHSANEGLALLQCDPGKEEQGGLFEDKRPGKAGVLLLVRSVSCSQLPRAGAFPRLVFFSNGEGVPALSLGNRDGPVGSQPGVKADGDKIK